MSLEEFLTIKKVLICVGSGGVGKTTTSASIAVRIAKLGRRVIVCTIDPAKRLATSLGLKELGNEASVVAEYGNGRLSAMMLDVKATFDSVVERYAGSAEAKERILNNRYYQHVSNALSVSQEFMAMEKLHELSQSDEYDVIVLDTPPTKNTIDFLKTPELIISAMDDKFTRWMIAPYSAMNKKRGFGLAAFAMDKVFNVLGRLFGLEAIKDVSEFVYVMQAMTAGFRERADKVKDLIRDIATGFIIVATAKPQSCDEALFFYSEVERLNADVIGVILNRLQFPDGLPKLEALESLWGQLPAELVEKVKNDTAVVLAEGEREIASIERLKKSVPEGIIQTVPQFERDIHDLPGLEFYSEHLV